MTASLAHHDHDGNIARSRSEEPAPRLGHVNKAPRLPGSKATTGSAPFVSRVRDLKLGSPGRKLVLLVLASFCPVYADGAVGECWPTNRTLCEATELSINPLKIHLEALVLDGYLGRRGRGKGRRMTVNLKPRMALNQAHSEGTGADANGIDSGPFVPANGIDSGPQKVRTRAAAAADGPTREQIDALGSWRAEARGLGMQPDDDTTIEPADKHQATEMVTRLEERVTAAKRHRAAAARRPEPRDQHAERHAREQEMWG